ncbi:alpha/beta-hydrolase [Clathrospora elynae]|uniref:Alpha/beta-hydrolase n=1 Tax=Clathrospora elynae TaxID=706981 RepID=A0A6A5SWA7_9PLEO|nr:alpha/beta-hydrolase [Clathrospora elynae]
MTILTTMHRSVDNTPEASTDFEPPKCRYRLDNDSSDTLTLPDGRKLGYAQYGSPTGHAIIYVHGLPGSRIKATGYHDLGLDLGARIIGVDRPGMGWSTPQPDRKILDFAKDVEHLTGHFGLKSYSVIGLSGGGPYALACAASLPSQNLKCVSLVCGLGPPDIGMSDAVACMDLDDEDRLESLLSPSFLKTLTHEKDRQVFQDTHMLKLMLRATREAWAQGFEGIAQDGRTMCTPALWGFRVEDIRKDLLMLLWCGKDDTFVQPNHGVQIATRLGGRAELRVGEDTHASISQHWRREQVEAILGKM